jgi:rubrerythrin
MDVDVDTVTQRSRALDLAGIPFDDVARHPLPTDARRTLRYMQDIESHTIVYLRTLLATPALDDPEVAAFLACWFHEETAHGRALARFLAAAGEPVVPRPRGRLSFAAWVEARATAIVGRLWPHFVAVHMVWGAINELTTLVGYQRLAARARHPVLSALLGRIVRDEARHFGFYYRQAARRLARPTTARIARRLVDRFWAPVGTGVQPVTETRFVARYLLADDDGRRAARKVDETIRALPGFRGANLLEAWVARHALPS